MQLSLWLVWHRVSCRWNWLQTLGSCSGFVLFFCLLLQSSGLQVWDTVLVWTIIFIGLFSPLTLKTISDVIEIVFYLYWLCPMWPVFSFYVKQVYLLILSFCSFCFYLILVLIFFVRTCQTANVKWMNIILYKIQS